MRYTKRCFLVDTGASKHITPHPGDLARSIKCNFPFEVVGGSSVPATYMGHMVLMLPTSHKTDTSADERPATVLKATCFKRVYCIPSQKQPILGLPALRAAGIDLDLQEDVLFSYSDPSIRVPVFYQHGLPHVRIAVTTDKSCYQQAFAAAPSASVKEDALSRIKESFGPFDLITMPADCAPRALRNLRWTKKKVFVIPPPDNSNTIHEVVLKALREFSSHKPPDTCITMLVPIRPQSRYHPYLSQFHRAAIYCGSTLFGGGREELLYSAAEMKFGLYYKDTRTQSHLSPTMLLHLRLGHPSPAIMEKLVGGMEDPEKETGLPGHMAKINLRHNEMCTCVVCMAANQRRPRDLGPHVDTHEPDGPFSVVGMDIHGPLVASPDKFEYALIFVCYSTRWIHYESLHSKGEAGAALGRFILWVKNQEWSKRLPSATCPIKVIQVLKSDNAKEFIGQKSLVAQFCASNGILQYRAAEYCHEEMGMVEKRWSPIASKSRAMLLTASMSSDLWPHSYRHAVYLENRLPKQVLGWKSPYETLCGRKPTLSHLLTFGSPCSLVIGDTGADAHKPKTANRAAANLLWVGHADNSNSALFLDLEDRRTIRRGGMFRSMEISGLPNMGRISHPWEFDKFAPLSSEFDIMSLDKPLVASADGTAVPTIVGHRVHKTTDADDRPRFDAVLLVQPTADADNQVYLTVSSYISSGGTSAARRLAAFTSYVANHFSEHPLNEYYPLFAQCSVCKDPESTPAWETGAVVSYTQSPTRSLYDVLAYKQLETLRSLSVDHVNLDNTTSDPAMPAIMAARSTMIGDEVVTDVQSLKDILGAPDAPQWNHVIIVEIQTLQKMSTWDITIPCPPGVTPVEVTLKFKVKRKADGSLDKRKARLVARGFKQIYMSSYTDTFAPASQLDSLRLLVSYAAQYNLKISSIDVVGAFLNATLKEDIWIKFPHDLPVPELRGRTAKLVKSLYGLKQAAHDWWILLRSSLQDMGVELQMNSKDPCMYHIFTDTLIVVIIVHVDDCIVAYSDDKFMKMFRDKIEEKYETTYSPKPEQVLGIKLDHLPSGGFALSNTRLIDETVSSFGQSDANPVKIPMDPGTVLDLGISPPADPLIPFLSIIGILMWIMRCTRPDISVAVSILASFSHCFNDTHFKAAIKVLLFLKGTRLHALVYTHTPHVPRGVTRLSLYTDSDYAVCRITRRSRTGWVLLMGTNVISYSSTRQKLVTMSSTESELVSMCDGVKDLLGTIQVLRDFIPAELPVPVHVDNQGTIAIGTDEIHNSRTKHIDVRYFFTRELVDDGTVDILYINTNDNPADPLTKLLAYPSYSIGMQRLSLLPPGGRNEG